MTMVSKSELNDQDILAKVTQLQDGLVAYSTGGTFPDEVDYPQLRATLLGIPRIQAKLPAFLRRCRDLGQFWQFIKQKCGSYAERRTFLWDSFGPLIGDLELEERSPSDASIGDVLSDFDPENVQAAWQKALDRRAHDPDGAITAARTLLETVCKHLLDDLGTTYDHDADLPKLWSLCSSALNLSPSQHSEPLFKAILGNCQSVVNNLAAIRNKVSDAHGTGRRPVKPKPRHAELAVNLAGTMAAFLVATWKDRKSTDTEGNAR